MTKALGVQGLLVGAEWVLGGIVAPVALLPSPWPDIVRHQPLWYADAAAPEILSGISQPSSWVVVETAAWVVGLHFAYRGCGGALSAGTTRWALSNGQAVRTLRLVWWGWKAEFSGAAEYRMDLVSGTFVSVVRLGLAVAPMLVVAANSASAPGWTLPRLLFLQVVWYLLDGVLRMIIAKNARELSTMVRDGTLDAVLLRPVSALVMCTLGHVHVQDVPKVVLAVALGVVSCVLGGGPASVLALQAAHNLARVPVPLYGVVLTVVVPVAFLTTVPARVLFGAVSLWWVPASILLTALVLRETSWRWNRELRSYTGAMG